MKRRILFCTWGYAAAMSGGAERQAQLQAEELVQRGYQVAVVCPRWPGTASEDINGVWIWRLGFINLRPFKLLSYIIALLAFLLVHASRFDLLSVHLAYFQADAAVLAGLVTRRPVWVKVAASGKHGEIDRMKALVPFTPYLGLKRATRVQATSQEIVEELQSIGVPPGCIVRIPNGVDTSIFVPPSANEKQRFRAALDLPANRLIVLFVGRLARHKGIHDLLRAWTIVFNPGTLVLVGSDATMDVAHFSAPDNVVVRGWTDSPYKYYGAADIFVLPSHVEGMSNAMLEAMASGLPVLATRVGAADAIIDDGKNGILVSVGDYEALARNLSRLLSDGELRKRLGCAAVRTVRDRYSVGGVVDNIESAYERVLDRP